jgi:hypothetical protein
MAYGEYIQNVHMDRTHTQAYFVIGTARQRRQRFVAIDWGAGTFVPFLNVEDAKAMIAGLAGAVAELEAAG